MSCSDCFKGFAHNGTPVGTEETLHGMRTYIAGPPGAHTSPSTVIFITDAFGFNLVNSKLLADRYATETGFRVLVPDIIPGGGVPLHSLALTKAITTPVQWWNVLGHLARIANVIRAMTIFIPFATRTRGIFPATLEYTRAVKAALPQGAKLGAVGFCWGGMQTTKLSAEPAAVDGDSPLLDAHFVAHPSGLKVPDDFIDATKKFKVPFSMAVGDKDMILSTAAVAEIEAGVREAFGEVAAERCQVEVYPSCGHGFSVRADPKLTIENEAAGQAAQQAVEWFKKWLVVT